MEFFIITCVTLALVATTVVMHYEILRYTTRLIPRLSIQLRVRMIVVIIVAFCGHILQIALYALAYWMTLHFPSLGRLSGSIENAPLDYFYYSAATFTTLGVGDIIPEGPIRFMAGVELLNGLILITWSASFTYIAMEKFWTDHPMSPRAAASARSRGGSPNPPPDPQPHKRRGRPPHG